MTQKAEAGRAGLHMQLHSIVAEELELEPDELTDTGHFVEDYDADSLTLITVAARIDRELGISVPDTEWSKLINMTSLVGVIDRYVPVDTGHV